MKTKILNEEVIFTKEHIVKVNRQDVEKLILQSDSNYRKRIRLCAHLHDTDTLHEMIIIHARDTYVRPHKHLNKIESFHIIQGSADIILFDEEGMIVDIIAMGVFGSDRHFYYRLSEPMYHTLLIDSEYLVFHEITNGPFIRANTIWAPWAPDDSNHEDARIYMTELKRLKHNFVSQTKSTIEHG